MRVPPRARCRSARCPPRVLLVRGGPVRGAPRLCGSCAVLCGCRGACAARARRHLVRLVGGAPKLRKLFLEANDARKDLDLPDLVVLLLPLVVCVTHHRDDDVELQEVSRVSSRAAGACADTVCIQSVL